MINEPECGRWNATPVPADPAERLRLEAYARYRILLLHTLHRWTDSARVVYDGLQQRFPKGREGHPYAELATVFWNEYAATNNISRACYRAIEYAGNQGDAVLKPLGSDFYGDANPDYAPEDICPF